MKLILLFAAIITNVISQFTLANTAKLLSSYQTLATGVTYDLNFTLTRTVPAGSTVMLTFASQYRIPSSTLTSCQGSKSSSVAAANAACSSVYTSGLDVYSIVYSDLYTVGGAQTFLWVKFNINNPWGETSSRVDIYILDNSSSIIQTATFIIDYVASTLGSCSINGATSLTGENVSTIVKFTPSRDLISGSYILITLPFWFIGSSITTSNLGSSSLVCSGIQNTDSASLTCSINTNNATTQIIKVQNFVSTNKTSPGQLQIQLDSLRNPWSLAAFGQITYEIYYTGLIVTQRCKGIYRTVTTPNKLTILTFNMTQFYNSGVNSGVQLILAIKNPLLKNKTRLRVEYSSEAGVAYSGAGTIFSQNATQLIFTNIATSDKTAGSLIFIGFSITTPPSTRLFTFKFTTEYLNSGIVYDIDTISQDYQNNPGVITSTGIIVSNPIINTVTSYQIQFSVASKLISGGFIQIIFPTSLSIDPTAVCSTNITNVSSCVINSKNVTLTINGNISSLTSFLVTIDKVKNSAESTQTSTFCIYSYYDSLYTSLVDKLDTGLTVTMTANPISTALVTPLSLVTYAATSYQFDFTLKDDIYQNGYIQIELPSTVIPGTVTLTSASFSIATCTVVPNSQIIRLSNCFSSGAMTTRVTRIVLGGIRNPPSYKTTGSFKIQTYSSVPTLTNYITAGITVQMTIASILTALTIVPTDTTVNSDTIYTLTLTHLVPLAINEYLIVNFDSTMFISNPLLSCTAVTNISTIGCTRNSNTQLKVTYTSLPSSQSLNFQVSNLRNYAIADTSLTFDATVYTIDDFIKEKGTTTSIYSKASISTFTVNNDDKIILYGDSQITLTISTPFSIPATFDPTKTKLQITLPTGLVAQNNSTCTVTTGTCVKTSSTLFTITSVGLGLSSYSIVMTNILLPFINVQSPSFSIVYTYNTKNVSAIQTGVVVLPYCTSPCKACQSTKVKCLSCLPTPNTLVYYDKPTFTCLSVCLDGTYPDSNKICQNCIGPCVKCLDTVNCTSCVANTWLSGKSCVNPCPNTFYNDSTGVCLPCQDPCNKCLSQTSCLSCKTDFYYNFSCVIQANCPAGTYGNTTTLICELCKSPCLTCLKLQSNCIACVDPFLYYDNTCANSCPNGKYQSGKNCLNCVGLCLTCSNASVCLSCVSDYLYNGQCVTSTNCPAGTFPDAVSMTCKTCPSGCTGCSSLANCSSCDTNFYIFYQFTCITQCPPGTYKSGFTCQTCTSPCATCDISPTNCQSCISTTYLYNNSCPSLCPKGMYQDVNKCSPCKTECSACDTGNVCTQCSGSLFLTSIGQCLAACPSGFFQNFLNNKCDLCTSPCSDCKNLPDNCTGCIPSRVLYGNSCGSSSCPSQYFNVSGICKTCSNCSNCLSASVCDSCQVGYFLYSGLCYTSCPVTAPIQDLTTQSCTLCSQSCQNCNGSAKNCTSCNQDQYLFNSGCYDSCPSGYVQNPSKKSCQEKQISSIFYFPSMFGVLAVLIVLIYSKCNHRETQFITVLTAFVSIFCLISWIVFLLVLYLFEFTLERTLTTNFVFIVAIVIALSFLFGIGYQIYVKCAFDSDLGYSSWTEYNIANSKVQKIIIIASLVNFIFYRFIYGRLFNRLYFSLCYSDGQRLLTNTHRLALCSILFQLLPMVGVSFYTIYKKQIYDQTVYSALDTLIINAILIILLFIDGSKSGEQFFGQMRKQLPYSTLQQTKGKYLQVDSNVSIADLEDYQIQKQKRIKTEAEQKQKQNFFRKINCIENLNKFGHLNEVIPNQQQNTKSLPQHYEIKILPSFNPNGYQDEVMDDLFFQREEEQQQLRRQTERIKQELQAKARAEQQVKARAEEEQELMEQQKALFEKEKAEKQKQKALKQLQNIFVEEEQEFAEQEQISPEEEVRKKVLVQQKRKREQQIKIQQYKKQEQERQQRERLQRLLEDQLQQQNLQCVDIVAIDKAQSKNKQKKSPLDFLSKCKTVDEKPIDDKAVKKLEDISKKNGIDPQFMKETFGVQKHHNQELLNSIIDKHHHVNREAVKQMFKQTNNKQVLQQLFSKNSTVDTQKLKQIMNDKQGMKMIQKLMDAEKGIVSAEIAKTLLEKNSKFKPEFTKKLLSGQSGADDKKLQDLLKNGESENARDENLKALKKIGGQTLSNTQLIKSMLGQDSKLNPQQFTKAALNLSMKALESLFKNKSPQSQKIVDKIINNKKLNLKQLSPIIQDQEIIYELGQVLGNGNPILQENIMNLLKNSIGTADPQKLKAFLKNQALVQKLMGDTIIDPDFLTEILKNDGNTNLQLLEKTLNQMTPEQVKNVFEFTGNKNIDYKSLSKIFQENQNTDPNLVKQMMDPELINEVFTKNNNVNANMLTKLVQKGSKFDKQNIVNIYGKNTDNIFNYSQNGFNKQGRMTNRTKKGFSGSQGGDTLTNNGRNPIIENKNKGNKNNQGNQSQIDQENKGNDLNGEKKNGNKMGNNMIGNKGSKMMGNTGNQTGNWNMGNGRNAEDVTEHQNFMQEVNLMGNTPMGNNRMGNNPMGNNQMGNNQMGNNQMGNNQKNNMARDQIIGNYGNPIYQANGLSNNQNMNGNNILGNSQGHKGGPSVNYSYTQGDQGNTFYNPYGPQTEYDFKFTFNKTANENFNQSQKGEIKKQNSDNQMIMSRTDGGMMGFLNPLKIKQQKDKLKGTIGQRQQFDDLGERIGDEGDEEDEEQNYRNQEAYRNQQAILQQDDQQGQTQFRKRKPPAKKRKLKKITDIRHPAQKIYLEPIVAAHQMQNNKNFRKKKKKDQSQSASKLIMDEDNDVFDIDF